MIANALLIVTSNVAGRSTQRDPPQRLAQRQLICVTVARPEAKCANGASVARLMRRICVTVARPEAECANGASVASAKRRICVTVARPQPKGVKTGGPKSGVLSAGSRAVGSGRVGPGRVGSGRFHFSYTLSTTARCASQQ